MNLHPAYADPLPLKPVKAKDVRDLMGCLQNASSIMLYEQLLENDIPEIEELNEFDVKMDEYLENGSEVKDYP